MKKVLSIILSMFISILAFQMNIGNIQAESGTTLSPISAELTLNPGEESALNSFTITNDNEFDIEIKVSTVEVDLSTYNINSEDIQADSYVNWIKFNEEGDSYLVSKGEKKEVKYSINVPELATPGVYTPAIKIEMLTKNDLADSEETNVVGTKLVGVLMYQLIIQVATNEGSADLQITNFSVGKYVNYKNPITLNVGITNKSTSSYAKPLGRLQILDPRGNVIYQETINDDLSYLINGKDLNQVITTQLDMFKLGNIGKYSAELLVYDTAGQSSDVEKTEFWVLPYSFIAIFTSITLLTFIIIFSVYKARSKKDLEETRHQYK